MEESRSWFGPVLQYFLSFFQLFLFKKVKELLSDCGQLCYCPHLEDARLRY